jgi:transposase-like protein
MDIHKNARLTPLGRERLVKMVLGGQTPKAVSEAVGVCPRTARKWVGRYEQEGLACLQKHSRQRGRMGRHILLGFQFGRQLRHRDVRLALDPSDQSRQIRRQFTAARGRPCRAGWVDPVRDTRSANFTAKLALTSYRRAAARRDCPLATSA